MISPHHIHGLGLKWHIKRVTLDPPGLLSGQVSRGHEPVLAQFSTPLVVKRVGIPPDRGPFDMMSQGTHYVARVIGWVKVQGGPFLSIGLDGDVG